MSDSDISTSFISLLSPCFLFPNFSYSPFFLCDLSALFSFSAFLLILVFSIIHDNLFNKYMHTPSKKTLISTITTVHANNSSVIRYNFDLYNSLPIDWKGSPIISAAIPALKQKPSPILQADIKPLTNAGT